MKTNARLSRREIARIGVAGTGAAVATSVLGGKLMAQEATPVASPEQPALPPLPEGATVVAQGLLSPRNIAIAGDTLYVGEQGVGGDEVLEGPPPGEAEATPAQVSEPEATPVEEEAAPPSTRGYTGQITAIALDGSGTTEIVLSGLASYSDGVGVVGLSTTEGGLYYAIGGAAVGLGLDPLPEENTVNWLDLETGESVLIAELGPYEESENPDGTDVNPNLYDLVQLSDGTLVVNDAGGNVVYSVDPETSEFSPITVLPLQGELPGASADPAAAERQVVPTGLALDAEDTIHVSLLSEFWPADAPSIVTVDPDGTVAPVATGLSTIVDITFGPDGNLYATSLTADLETFAPGSVLRIGADGTAEPVVEGLFMPAGIAFDDEGNLYVAVYSLIPGAGTVARFDGIATPA